MLKHLAVPVLGLVVLAGATVPAAAGKDRVYVVKPANQYSDATGRTVVVTPKSQKQRSYKGVPRLDFETEAVWRNLRPNLFVD